MWQVIAYRDEYAVAWVDEDGEGLRIGQLSARHARGKGECSVMQRAAAAHGTHRGRAGETFLWPSQTAARKALTVMRAAWRKAKEGA